MVDFGAIGIITFDENGDRLKLPGLLLKVEKIGNKVEFVALDKNQIKCDIKINFEVKK